MCVTTKVIVLVLILLIAACNNSSQPEQVRDISELIVASPDPATEFEEAKRECADKGGEWVWYDHGDELEHYFNIMRCWSLDDPPRRPGDGRWREPGLLPYDVLVRYFRQSHKVTDFGRFEPNSK